MTSEKVDDELKRAVVATQEENRRLRTVLTQLEEKETKLQVSGPPSFSYLYNVENVATSSISGVVGL